MLWLVALLALNVVLHVIVVARFGLDDPANRPFAAYVVVGAILALGLYFGVRYATIATLVFSVIGLVGLTVTFNTPKREEKTLDKAIWALDALIVLVAAYVTFLA
jgi:hypothetical protein